MFFCISAAKLPTNMVASADDQTNGSQRFVIGPRAVVKTRTNTANAAALGPADMNNVTGAGAPWYTSGAQTWNGAAETLNAKPTNMSAAAVPTSAGLGRAIGSAALISVRFVCPVMP